MKIQSLQNEKYHINSGAKMMAFAGYNMPIWYSSIADENNCVRKNIGVFDVSHMGEFIISGNDSKKFLQVMTSNNIERLEKGKVQYSLILNKRGGIIDDLLVYDLGNKKYMLVVNASNMEKDLKWLIENNNLDVIIENKSKEISLFAIQGPKSIQLINKIFNKDFSLEEYYTFKEIHSKIFGNILISVTGYTGAGGFELYVENKYAVKLWNKIIDYGKEFKIQPIGLGARDTLRLEMGFCLHGNDIDENINPIESDLGWICKKKIDFIGKSTVDRDRNNNPKKILIGFKLKEKGIARKGYKIFNEKDNLIGEVTSGSISPFLMKSIGMGYVDYEENKISKYIYIEVRNKKIKAKISKRPFI